MLKKIVIFGLLFVCIFVLYGMWSRDDSRATQIEIDRSLSINENFKITAATNDNYSVEPGSKKLSSSAPKIPLKAVTLDPSEIKNLQLNNFHAYLRYSNRLAKDQDGNTAEYILTPEQRKEIAKERIAVKLIDVLSSGS